jgi:hypothetical protein
VMYRYSWGDSANLQKSPSINQLNMMDDCKWQIVKYNIYDLDSMKELVEFHY